MAGLTPKMREAIARMAAGETLIEVSDLAWLVKDGRAETLDYRTFRALWHGKWIGRGSLRYIFSLAPKAQELLEAQP